MGAPLNRLAQSGAFESIPTLDDASAARALDLERGNRELRASHLHAEAPATPAIAPPFDAEAVSHAVVVGEHVRDGVDYTRICFLHRRASRTVVSVGLAEHWTCPECAAAVDGSRERYRELTGRLVLVGR